MQNILFGGSRGHYLESKSTNISGQEDLITKQTYVHQGNINDRCFINGPPSETKTFIAYVGSPRCGWMLFLLRCP